MKTKLKKLLVWSLLAFAVWDLGASLFWRQGWFVEADTIEAIWRLLSAMFTLVVVMVLVLANEDLQ